MPDYDFQVCLQHRSGMPEDIYVNVLHFDVVDFASVENAADDVRDLYVANNLMFVNTIDSVEVKVYEPGVGGPVYTTPSVAFGGNGEAPGEVAMCLSYYADDQANTNKRRRGRIYLGPMSLVASDRPSAAKIAEVLAFGESLAQIGLATGVTWKMYSKANNSYHKIERIAVDNAWDTQRRRGLSPTVREFRDVQ
jgi:hypothetical protein